MCLEKMARHRNTCYESSAFGSILRNVVFRVGDAIMGHPMVEHLNLLEKAQYWEKEKLCQTRNTQLNEMVQTAYSQVPFYRNLFDRSNVRPDEIQQVHDLMRLPLVTKEMLTAGYPIETVRPTGQETYEVKTSGSTGKNFCLCEDNETAGLYRASFILALEWAGWRFGEAHMQTGMTTKRSLVRHLKDSFLRCHYVPAFDISDSRIDENLNKLAQYNIKHLWGYPGSLFFLAQRAIKRGWNEPLKTVVTWGDNLYPQYRTIIEAAFGAKVMDTYGCGEGIQISAQCGQGSHYHIHMLDTVVEFLDDGGDPVPDDMPGNIVLTRLHPGPMPLIRYCVGDVGIRGAQFNCGCGCNFETMASIQGRDTDIVITPSGNRLIVHFFTGVLEFFREIDSFQVLQNALDSIILRVKPRGEFTKSTIEMVTDALRSKGADLKIHIELVDEIPLESTGKRKFIISKVGKDLAPFRS